MVFPVAILWLGGVQAQASDLYQPVNKWKFYHFIKSNSI